MKTKKEIEVLTAAEVLTKFDLEGFFDATKNLENLAKGRDFDQMTFKELTQEYDLYYCTRHNIFHEYYYETDDSDLYLPACRNPVCPLCLLDIDIQG